MRVTEYVLISLLTGAAALAQGPPGNGRGPGRGFGPGGPRGGPGFGAHGGKVVANAPYSADVSFSRVTTMVDGNTIQNTASGKVARDAQGRTYSLETFTGGPLGQNGPVTRISVFDPVAGYAYELNPTAKTATRRAIRQHTGSALWQGKPDASRPLPPDVVKTDLGVQTTNGVSAQGTRSVRTIPAGAIGNSMPIVSTTETWRSPQLQVVVSSTHTDPRAGQTNYALTNIVQAAPDPSLFQVPAGYTVKDAPAPHGGRGFGPPGPPPQE